MVTFDRDTKEHGFVILPSGEQYDVYGDTTAELKAGALEIADWLGVEIEVWNWELPE